jgi:hypothetical protein
LGYDFIGRKPDLNVPLSAEDRRSLACMRQDVIALCRDAALVMYDTMFNMSEYRRYPHWGHSAPEHAIEIAHAAGAKLLALYHHHPQRTDDELDQSFDGLCAKAPLPLICAAEGMAVEINQEGPRVIENPALPAQDTGR